MVPALFTHLVQTRVRLRAGAIPSTGRLEVFYDGEWGTVCGSHLDFTLSDANVACLSMGFGSASFIAYNGNLGKGFDRVWLNRVGCSGKESSLEECKHPEFGVLDDYWCERHYRDIGLTCNSPQDGLDCESLVSSWYLVIARPLPLSHLYTCSFWLLMC